MKNLTELFVAYCDEMHNTYGKVVKNDSYSSIRDFIRFSMESCHMDFLNQEVVDDWCMKGARESTNYFNVRVASLRLFLTFANRNHGAGIILPEKKATVIKKKRLKQSDKPFQKTLLSDYLEEYVKLLRTSGRYREDIHGDLIRLNRNLVDECNSNNAINSIDNEMFGILTDKLYKKCTARSISAILNITRFFEYTNFRGYTNISLPEVPSKKYKQQRTPYPFSDSDLQTFFIELDKLPARKYEDDRSWKFRRMQASVAFRLLFSSGIRTNELRELKRYNVDWEYGTIDIEQTKGYHQHRIALHPSIQEILKRYDSEMDILMPNRCVLFPTAYDEVHKAKWLEDIFNEVWNKISNADARPYDFRSNYAVRNINSWQLGDPRWIDKFMFLSRSMGHADLASTAYYYQLVPMFREILERQTSENLRRIQPNMDEFLNPL